MQKHIWKRLLSVLLVLTLAVLTVVPSLAAADSADANPILIVSGFTEYVLQNTETGEAVFPHNTEKIVSTVASVAPSLLTLLASARTQADYDAFCDEALPIINTMFDEIACNPDGTVKHPEVQLKYQYPESVATYGVEAVGQSDAFDKDILYGAVDAVGADKVYVYGLDWRLNPMDIADELNDWVQHIKEVQNCDKVSIAGISMGGVMVSAYLAKYGTDDVSNVTMISSAFTGLSYVGALFQGGVQIDEDGLYNMLTQAVGTDTLSRIFGSTGMVKQVIALIDDLYAAEQDRIFTECLIPAFGYNPGMWSFVPAEDYEGAKEFMFARMDATDAQKQALTEKIDAYHEVQANAENTLKAAKAAGVNVAVISNYNFQIAPVAATSKQTSDQVIETVHTSGYATCANLGETLPASVKDGKYVSADRVIDASTCFLPDNTWFIKNMQHVGFDNSQNQCKFYLWLMTTDEQVDVNSNPDYPQFMLYNEETKVLSPLAMLRGDVNFDGKVNLVDARITLRYVHSLVTLSPLAKEAADMDGNSKISNTDAQMILNVYAGVETVEETAFSADQIKEAVSGITEQAGSDGTGDTGNALSGITDKIGEVIGALGDSAGASEKGEQLSAALENLPEMSANAEAFTFAQPTEAQTPTAESDAVSETAQEAA
ncbi:MAG: dockerin type I domain-containing protein [Candidatus Fimenecus sp.]